MKIVWDNSSLSGLCDRFIDLFLMAAMARVLSSELIVPWKINRNFGERQLRVWDKARFDDYKYENFSQYFHLPNSVKVMTEEDFSQYDLTDHVYFSDYLGGIFTPTTFHQRHLGQICSFEAFDEAHRQVLAEFLPKQKLLDIIGQVPDLDLAIHLRRGDKVNENPNNVEISNDALQDLDEMTKTCADKIVSRNEISYVFICSDEESSTGEYEKRYSEMGHKIIKPSRSYTRIERTYVDLFLLSKAKTIVMSQRHSNFSLFASQLHESKLVYFYPNNPMINDRISIFHKDV